MGRTHPKPLHCASPPRGHGTKHQPLSPSLAWWSPDVVHLSTQKSPRTTGSPLTSPNALAPPPSPSAPTVPLAPHMPPRSPPLLPPPPRPTAHPRRLVLPSSHPRPPTGIGSNRPILKSARLGRFTYRFILNLIYPLFRIRIFPIRFKSADS